MRTIIPFPLFRCVGDDPVLRKRLRGPVIRFSSHETGPGSCRTDLPEGETVDTAISQMPRAKALSDGIIGLISAVRGRFG